MYIKSEKTKTVISKSISLITKDQIDVINVSNEYSNVGISLFGGQLLWYRPSGEKDIIWLSDLADFTTDTPIRGGVPICFPWFGKSGGEQTHGFARNTTWELYDFLEETNKITITLSLKQNDDTIAMWPHKFTNLLTFEIDDKLTIRMKTTNTDNHSWSYSGALHSYFNVCDINHTSISGVGHKYYDGVLGYVESFGNDQIVISDETIRVCQDPRSIISITDQMNRRNILVENKGNDTVVVWNPWKATTLEMHDMKNDDYQRMLCVESTIYEGSGITLAPSQSHILSTCIYQKEIN